jgi:hypothetical protein
MADLHSGMPGVYSRRRSGGFLVLAAVAADGIGWREDCEEMRIKLPGRRGGQAAKARQGRRGFVMQEAVSAPAVAGGEHLQEMIVNRVVVSGLGEAASASVIGHVSLPGIAGILWRVN